MMTNQLAIAAVSAVLRDLLNNGLADHDISGAAGGNVTVSAQAPDRVPIDGVNLTPRLNLFLYAVTPNSGWRNVALPSRDAQGERLSSPPLALDLHYFLTAYGVEDLQAELLLGYAMSVLHETPILTRAAIRAALAPAVSGMNTGILPAAFRALASDDLANQIETLKVTHQPMSTEEMSRLWSACQAKYRPSAAYTVGVVLISSKKTAREGPPVATRNVAVLPAGRPVLESVMPAIATPGTTLTLRGCNLSGQGTEVLFGDTAVPAASATNDTVTVVLPGALPAGVQRVKVRQLVSFGALPTDPHRALDSNILAFLLAPTVAADTPAATTGSPLAISVVQNNALILGVSPAVGAAQDVQLLVGDRTLALPPRAAGTAAIQKVSFGIPASFPPGDYLMRLRVDSAESGLTSDAQGFFNGPKLRVTGAPPPTTLTPIKPVKPVKPTIPPKPTPPKTK